MLQGHDGSTARQTCFILVFYIYMRHVSAAVITLLSVSLEVC